MKFLLQNYSEYGMDNIILKKLIENENFLHEYIEISLCDFYDNNILKNKKDFNIDYTEYIPLGTIQFTQDYFKIFHNIEKLNPIEIPKILRNKYFLNREYKIVSGKDIPKTGNYFIKDVNDLKQFTYCGTLPIDKTIYPEINIDNKKLYQLSEIIDIISEYRVVFIDGELYSITNYDGDVTVYPDIELLQKANQIYQLQPDCPKSYSLDVAITKQGLTSILEIHILFSTGIYTTVNGSNYLYGLRDAYYYTLNHNSKINI